MTFFAKPKVAGELPIFFSIYAAGDGPLGGAGGCTVGQVPLLIMTIRCMLASPWSLSVAERGLWIGTLVNKAILLPIKPLPIMLAKVTPFISRTALGPVDKPAFCIAAPAK